MDTLAAELNRALDNTVAGRLLSALGRRIFFPKGIISQAAEARQHAHKANTTIGMALHKKKPLTLSAIIEPMPSFTPEEIVSYAPTSGLDKLREVWRAEMLKKNPSLNAGCISLPIVVPGLTAGVSYMGDLFLEEGKTILTAIPYWDNYELLFSQKLGATITSVPFIRTDSPGGLDLASIKKAMEAEASKGTVRLLFSFPQNPSGHSPTKAEAKELTDIVLKCAEDGADILIFCDDAYFGLFYEDNIHKESLFANFANLHERVLAIKIDGATKEDYAWGLRTAFVTFGSKGLDKAAFDALTQKTLAIIRSSTSCSNTQAQHLLLRAINDKRTKEEKAKNHRIMEERYRIAKNFISSHPDHPVLKPLSCNSGYFMCFQCVGVSAEKLRQKLLTQEGVGTVTFKDDYLKVGFCCLDKEEVEFVFETIYKTATDLYPSVLYYLLFN